MKNWLLWLAGEESVDVETKTQVVSLAGEASETSAVAIPNERSLKRLLGLFVLVGLIARAIRYYLCFPLWDDESFLCVNFIDRSYADLLKPLDYHQVAPVLFLWLHWAPCASRSVSSLAFCW